MSDSHSAGKRTLFDFEIALAVPIPGATRAVVPAAVLHQAETVFQVNSQDPVVKRTVDVLVIPFIPGGEPESHGIEDIIESQEQGQVVIQKLLFHGKAGKGHGLQFSKRQVMGER